MRRRDFLRGMALAPLLGQSAAAGAWMFCGPFSINGAVYCYAGIRSPLTHVAAAAIDDRNPVRWCWAACIEMLFRYQGVSLGQARIVTDAWGSIGAVPTGAAAIAAGLERDWTAADGRRLRARPTLLPVSPVAAARVLETDTPLVLATPSHPVVLTRLRYVAMHGDNGSIQTADVHDPWPGQAQRLLSQPEWYQAPSLLDIRIV